MLQEKVMVADALIAMNAELENYAYMISQTEHQQLRQTLQKLRNDKETSQYELYTIAKSKNYYEPAQSATPEDIQKVRSALGAVSQAK